MWQRQRTMQRPRQQKQRPMRRIIVQDTSQPVMGGAVTQNTQQEQTVHSQSESHPRSSTTVQNRGGTVLPGTAGKAAGQNPPRSTNQPTGGAGKSYHSSNAQGQTVQTESAQQRSTFVQPPDTQRSAPNTAAPNAAPNNSGIAVCHSAQPGTACRRRRKRSDAVCAYRNHAAAQYLCADSEHGRCAASSRTSGSASVPSPRSGMAGNPSVPHSGVQPTSRTKRYGRKTARFSFGRCTRSALIRDTAGTGARPQQPGSPQNTPAPGTAGTQRTSIGGRYTQPVQQTTRVSTNGNTQITQQNHVSAQQSGGTVQPSSGVRMDGRSTNREHPAPTMPASPAAPSSNREAGTPPRSTTRPDAARPAEQRASQRPIPAQSGSAEKPIPQTGTQASPVSAASSERQSRKPPAPAPIGSVTAPAPVSQESRGPQRSPAAESIRQASGTAGTQGRYTAGAAEEGADALPSPRYRRNRAHGSWDQHGSSIGGAEARCGKDGQEAVRSADRQNPGIHSVASRSA